MLLPYFFYVSTPVLNTRRCKDREEEKDFDIERGNIKIQKELDSKKHC